MKNCLPRILVLALLGAPSASWADVVFLNHGARLEGRIVERSESSVEIDIGAGTLTLPMSTVERIEEGRSKLDDYEERLEGLAPEDREGWLALAQWASGEGLGTQSLQAYRHVLTIDPGDREANRALGRVEVDGRWMTREEGYRARGYVNFEGRWMMPDEKEATLRALDAERTTEIAREEARAAEARAQEAEAEADRENWRQRGTWTETPAYWNSWGPGPSTWPTATNPLDRPGTFGSSGSGGQV